MQDWQRNCIAKNRKRSGEKLKRKEKIKYQESLRSCIGMQDWWIIQKE